MEALVIHAPGDLRVETVATPEIDARIDAQKRNLDGLLQRFTEQHPDIIATRRVLQDLEQQKAREVSELRRVALATAAAQGPVDASTSPVMQELSRLLAASEVQVASLTARVNEYSARLTQARASLKTAPALEAEASQLNRDYALNRKNYDDLVARRQQATMSGDDITEWSATDRGRAGLFLAFQYPQAIAGVSVINFLRQALSARKGIDLSILELRLAIMEWMERLEMDPSFADRYLNEGFSGGEKKRNEILQMAILEPEMAVLDETDSGLDIDALRVVAKGVREVKTDRPELGLLVITHYQRLLDEIRPTHVHLLIDGRIAESGGMELATRLEAEGYEAWRTPVAP